MSHNCERCDALLARAEKAEGRLESSTDWYRQRYTRVRKWVEEEVRPLSAEVAHRYYSIIANGSADPSESADWSDTLHAWRMRAQVAEAEIARLRAPQPAAVGVSEANNE